MTETKNEQRYDAVTIVKSKKYRRYADLLCCFLEEDKTYTDTEIEKIICDKLKQPVQKEIN